MTFDELRFFAFGLLHIPKSEIPYYTLRELVGSYQKYIEDKTDTVNAIRDIVFGASRFNASSTAFSSEQSRKIGNYKFPWEKSKPKANGVSVHDQIGSFIRREERRINKKKEKNNGN